jgi:putative endopeptidase
MMRLFFQRCAVLVSIYSGLGFSIPSDGLHLDWRDLSVSPQQNFFGYANGTWQKKNPIPSHYPSWSSFSMLWDETQKQMHQILQQAAQDTQVKPGSLMQKVGDFYFSGMNEDSINQLGAKPLQDEFTRIDSIVNPADLQAEIAHLHLIGVDALFDFGSMQDFKDSQQMIGAVMQDGLSLPDRDYYLKEEPRFQKIRNEFVQYMVDMLQLLGDTPALARAQAKTILSIETTLARASKSQTELRDPEAIYHMMDVSQLDEMTPYFSWSDYLKTIDLSDVKRLNLATPDFFRVMNEQLHTVSLKDWKVYLRWHVLRTFAPYLSDPFVQLHFRMVQVLTGTKTLTPRWRRVVNAENNVLGFAIGKIYMEKYASPKAIPEVMDIMHHIHSVLRDDLRTRRWMSPATQKAALKKLALMEERLGSPKKSWDYSSLIVDRGPYVLNVMRANEFLVRRNYNKMGKPIDREEWEMTPQTVNAYYNPSMNNITIPMGILQPPFFDPAAPAAVNYGGIGSVIGHEITHGFDDQGAKFDGYGNLKNWWTPTDLKKFQAATDCIVQQFSQYKVDGDLNVRGPLVVGEATADLGGLTLAYRAFHASRAYKHAPTLHGFTPDQQFFLGYAHVWANNIRPEQARLLVITDPHPPAMCRVNGTLANMPEFQAAFHVPSTQRIKKRCVIW